MHLCFNKLPARATISSSIIMESFPACFSCSNSFIVLHSSLEFLSENIVEIPELVISGDLGKYIGDISLLLSQTFCLIFCFLFSNHTN